MQQLDRYVGDYDKFQEVYAVKKAQLGGGIQEAAAGDRRPEGFRCQEQGPRFHTEIWQCPVRKSWIKWMSSSWRRKSQSRNFISRRPHAAADIFSRHEDLVIGYDEPLSKPLNLSMERGQKIALIGANGIGKTTLLKSILGTDPAS